MKASFRFAALMVVVLVACRGESPSARMHALAARSGRAVEARLAGFAWSPMRVQRGSAPLDPARLELAGAAAAVIEKTPGSRDVGIGYLMIDRDADAVEALQQAAQQSPNDPKIWSDLAAARCTLAARGEKPYELPRALAAADHALRIDANLPDALFNRALIIEHLGITEAARRAWHRYLEADGTSKWADEALAHLGRLPVTTSDAQFRRDLALATAAMARGDAAPLAALCRNYPQDARKWGEGPLLADWADAIRAGDAAKAQGSLNVVRTIANTLAEWNHEQLLADAVASIDRAAGDPQRLATLAQAQATYRDGRILYSKHRIAEAQKMLQDSAEAFARTDSPMAEWARCYLASSHYDENQPVEAVAMLRAIDARIDRERYRALHGQIAWEITLCAMSAGAWAEALTAARDASHTFAALGESSNRANTDSFTAQMLGHMAQQRAAWKLWVSVFSEFSRNGAGDRLRNAIAEAVQKERAAGAYDAALALADINAADSGTPPSVEAYAHTVRARLLMNMKDVPRAASAIRDARTNVAAIVDPAVRARVSAVVDVAESIVVRESDPSRSRALLDRAYNFLSSRNEHAFLPDLYLQRGRSWLSQKNESAALADFETGIAELNAQRSTVADGNLRSSFYDSAPNLFAEAIALLLRRGDMARAFAYSDGARAQSLVEQIGAGGDAASGGNPSLAAVQQALPSNTAVLEYAMLPSSIAIFVVTPNGADVVEIPRDAASMQASVEHMRELLERRAPIEGVQSASADLHRILIGSAAAKIAGARQLILVPDRELNTVPFAALFNPASGRYLIEDYAISVAPSAGFLTRKKSAAPGATLVVGDPSSAAGPALPDAAHEAQTIASMYPSATLLIGERATRARFIESAENSAVIHYAGHAESDDAESYGSLRLAADGARDSGALELGDIARLKLHNAPLVVLAACGTIRGDAAHVEGMPSVARAFLAAGARDVVGTLWEIDDDIASKLFRRLHQQIRAGDGPAAALRDAQLALARDGDARLRHPSSWAPVEILGN
jgi:CHAT domain-containing protein